MEKLQKEVKRLKKELEATKRELEIKTAVHKELLIQQEKERRGFDKIKGELNQELGRVKNRMSQLDKATAALREKVIEGQNRGQTSQATTNNDPEHRIQSQEVMQKESSPPQTDPNSNEINFNFNSENFKICCGKESIKGTIPIEQKFKLRCNSSNPILDLHNVLHALKDRVSATSWSKSTTWQVFKENADLGIKMLLRGGTIDDNIKTLTQRIIENEDNKANMTNSWYKLKRKKEETLIQWLYRTKKIGALALQTNGKIVKKFNKGIDDQFCRMHPTFLVTASHAKSPDDLLNAILEAEADHTMEGENKREPIQTEDRVRETHNKRRIISPTKYEEAPFRFKEKCEKCGKSNHTSDRCLDHIICHYCKNRGHKESVCRKKERDRNIEKKSAMSIRVNDANRRYIQLQTENKQKVKFLIDTGSDIHIMTRATARRLELTTVEDKIKVGCFRNVESELRESTHCSLMLTKQKMITLKFYIQETGQDTIAWYNLEKYNIGIQRDIWIANKKWTANSKGVYTVSKEKNKPNRFNKKETGKIYTRKIPPKVTHEKRKFHWDRKVRRAKEITKKIALEARKRILQEERKEQEKRLALSRRRMIRRRKIVRRRATTRRKAMRRRRIIRRRRAATRRTIAKRRNIARRSKTRQIAAENNGESKERSKNYHATKIKNEPLQIGDLVLMQNKKKGKFEEKQFGPFEVTQLNTGSSVRIRNVKFPNKVVNTNVEKLTRFFDRKNSKNFNLEIEKIVQHKSRRNKNAANFKVRFKGLSEQDDAWLPRSQIKDSMVFQQWIQKK